MAKRAGKPAPAARRNNNGNDDDDEIAAGTFLDFGADQLGDLLEQFGGESGYRVYLERTEPRPLAGYLGTIDLADDFVDRVKAMPGGGGGAYGGRIVDTAGKYVQRIRFRIAGPPNPFEGEGDTGTVKESAADRQVRELREQIAELTRIVREGAAPKVPSAVDTLDLVKTVAGALRDIGGGGAAASSPLETLKMVREMMALQNEIRDTAGGASNDDPFALLKSLAPTVVELAKNARAAVPAAKPAAPGAGAKVLPLNPPADPNDPIARVAAMLTPLARKLLAAKATQGANTDLYAELALDQIERAQQEQLLFLLNTETNFGDRLCAIVPEFHGLNGWMDRFGMSLQKMLGAAGIEPKAAASA